MFVVGERVVRMRALDRSLGGEVRQAGGGGSSNGFESDREACGVGDEWLQVGGESFQINTNNTNQTNNL